MATDHFSELWDRLPNLPDDPSLGEEEMRRGVALHFFEAGRIFAQTEIRQKAIEEAARYGQSVVAGGMSAAVALRNFAADLIGLKESE